MTPDTSLPPDASWTPDERRDPADRERAAFARLGPLVDRLRREAPAWAAHWGDRAAQPVVDRASLARLPVLRKSALLEAQRGARERRAAGDPTVDPLADFSSLRWQERPAPSLANTATGGGEANPTAVRLFQSPGPIYEAQAPGLDPWRMARALHAAGIRPGDLVHNSFSYHLTPAGAMMEGGAHALGCTVFPGGTGQSDLQLQAMADLRPRAYVGTPSFLKLLLEKAAEQRIPLDGLRVALVSGEACPQVLRQWFAERGIAVSQCYATADLGLIAYETAAHEGLVVDEGVLVEIVQPGTDEPVGDGDLDAPPPVGEVVVTTLDAAVPLVRFGTGDLSAVLPGPCPTGRTGLRLRGWLGRADQATKVRGMFVHPSHVAEALRRVPGVGKARLVVSGELANDRMELQVEPGDAADTGLAARLADAMREGTRLRCDVTLVPAGSLPDDGRVIEDRRRLG